ncbi:helix-turn-helix transcriptional regulator [Acinetobacter baumannii]|uniref:winged helix-turn-helix transcriptional regulator n=1 Tax=Acinetobacter amyesii TaxID=2942470 RepID=UPI0020BE30A9|nr:helix-turn-helix domain-containing protein [Acinetobacter amyesii]MCL6230598.1 helix-turn-helix transcriptional regulator [Acinetobacter amyesii]MDC4441599.1 helix-turn-helix transcriptional regulator [Acinetobacter baumannii]
MNTSCGLDISLKIMGGKWKPLILYHLQNGPLRFSEIKRSMGSISEKVLIQQLRDLVAINVLNRHDYKCVPPMVDYSLTPFGETLVQALVPLCEWGNQNREQVTKLLQPSSELN